MILVSMERGDPTLYYGKKQLDTLGVSISSSQGMVASPSPQEDVLQKRVQEDEG